MNITCETCGRSKLPGEFRLLVRKPITYSRDCLACLYDKGILANPTAIKQLKKEHALEREYQREMARRELVRRRFSNFVVRFQPKYSMGWVHQLICDKLDRFMRQVERGESPRLMIFMPPRHGKLVSDDTPVLTTAGWNTHGGLCIGDEVFGRDGLPTTVVAIGNEAQATMELEFSDGSSVCVHPNHEWLVFDRGYNKERVVDTKWLARHTLRSGSKKQRCTYQLPLRSMVRYEAATLLVDPYLLGVWLGDGRSSAADFCFAEKDRAILERVRRLGYEPSWSAVHRTTKVNYVGFRNLKVVLRSLGLLNNKHIPECYLRSSEEQRLQLLAGLIDTDGHVEVTSGRVRIATVSDQLRDDLCDLVRGLGWQPYVFTQAPTTSTSGIVGRRPVHYIGFQPDRCIPTVLERKQIKRFAKRQRVGIAAVRICVPKVGRCIQVDAPDGLYLVGRELLPTHNSLLVSQYFPAYLLGHHPEWELIACSYGLDLPRSFSRKVRDLVREQAYHNIFAKTVVDKDNQNVEGWGTTSGGGYTPAGVGGPIAGKGAVVLLLDDLIKDAEAADSETIRNSTWDWMGSVATPRLGPGGGTILVMTRWHDADPAGRALDLDKQLAEEGVPVEERENWEVLSLPAILESEEAEYLTKEGKIVYSQVPDSHKVRSKGEALHPDRFNLSRLTRIKRSMQPRHWSALYQQNPVPDDGEYFKRSDFRYYDLATQGFDDMDTYTTWDPAIGKLQTSNYTVGLTGSVNYVGDIYLRDMVRGRFGTYAIVDSMINTQVRYEPSQQGMEKGALEQAIMPVLEREMQRRNVSINLNMELKPITDKIIRARPLQGRHQQGAIYVPLNQPWVEVLINEFLRFPNGTQDDIVDAGAWLARLVAKISLPRAPKRKDKLKSWRTKLPVIMRTQQGGSKSFMGA